MKKVFGILFFLFQFFIRVDAQSGFVSTDELSIPYFERQAILHNDSLSGLLGIYPLRRYSFLQLTESIEQNGASNTQLDYLKVENDGLGPDNIIGKNEAPILKYFYTFKGQFLSVRKKDFGVILNPILYLKYSNKQDSDDPVFQNTRGISVGGHIDNKVFFQSEILENQSSFPDWVERRMQRDAFVQGNGFNKSYSSDVFNIDKGYDYLNATGRFGFNATPGIEISFGYDRNFIGSGYRSLFLSDFSNNYSNLRINTRVWKIQYQNIFAEFFNNGSFSGPVKTKERKYFAGHYLKFNFTPNFHIGFFEGVIYSGELGIQPALLNPVIFYRSIEGFAGQEGNAMIGADFRLNLLSRFSLYGQLMLDEFKFDEVFGDPPGWWANKYGIQLGAKYFEVLGIKNLDGFAEFNTVRPYTYGHRDKITSYSHFNQPLAHPLGANFKEVILGAKYYLKDKWIIELRALRMSYGDDFGGSHWGTNILITSDQREKDYNNTISQGNDTDVWLIGGSLSYMLFHDFFVDLEFNLRDQKSELEIRNYTDSYVGLAFRLNIGKLNHDY